jgi:probable phosphoglycerate mutase
MRHGETVDNVNRILQGQTDGRLNDNGLRMAEEASRRMAGEAIDVFFSSDLGRCVDTCRIMARPHGKPIVQTPLLRERDWGSFTGLYIPDLKGREWPDDIETTEQMRMRAETFLHWIRAEYQGKTLLVVGHGIINLVILSILSGKPMRDIQKMANAEVRLLTID